MGSMENPPIPTQGEKLKDRLECYLSLIAEFGIYLYVFLLLFDRGEGLRTIGLYGALTAWLILTFFTKRIEVSIDIITGFFLVFITSAVLSAFFSIEPMYSLSALMNDALPATAAFLILSTYFNNTMILRLSKVICFSGFIILIFGLHSFLFHKGHIYTSRNILLSVDKNEYGFFIGLFLPFFFMFFMKSTKIWGKRLWGSSSVWGMLGSVFSASRGAIANICTAIGLFILFVFKRKHLKTMVIFALIFVLLVISSLVIIFSFNLWPKSVRYHLLSTPEELTTFHLRIERWWKPAFEAAQKKPLFGWGYGKKIYRDHRPFENGGKPDWDLKGGLHSTFITVLFHQGFFGLLSYIFLLLSTTSILFKMAGKERDERKLLALTLLSIIVGSFFVNSIVLTVPFKRIAPILGLSSALFKNRSNFFKDSMPI